MTVLEGRLAAPVGAEQYYTPQDRRVNMGGYEKKENEFIWSSVNDLEQMRIDNAPIGKNLLTNSGFEEYALPCLPDNWTHVYAMRQFGRDFLGERTDEVFEGRYSVRLHPTPTGLAYYHPTLTYRTWLGRQKGGHWQYDTDFVLSVYAKAGGGKAVLRLSLLPDRLEGGYDEKSGMWRDFPLEAGNWQRLEWPFRIAKNAAFVKPYENLVVGIRVLPDQTNPPLTVWVDAAQLEAGKQATPYERDRYRAPALDPKWRSDEVFQEVKSRDMRQP
jgi:hypothetical protein